MFDEETGLYYLLNRYFAPHLTRFINADKQLVRNLFEYANNNPICNEDKLGTEAVAIPIKESPDLLALAGVFLSGLIKHAVKAVPFILGLAIGFAPASTANDEAVWEAIQETEAYGTLETALISAKEKGLSSNNEPPHPTNIHHIVPKGMVSAKPARDILESVGIQPATSPENLVEVSTQMHQHMHTTAYVTSINAIISFASKLSSDEKQKKINVSLALSLIKTLIISIDNLGQ